MRRSGFAVLAILTVYPISANAQEWNAEQMEVWDAVIACWDGTTIDNTRACIHDDYMSFQNGRGTPHNKADLVTTQQYFLESMEVLMVHRKPLHIDVRGDFALVLYVVDYAQRNRRTGEEVSGVHNWTEVFVRDGGVWKALTDHGSPTTGGN
jgi:hypothetical protein